MSGALKAAFDLAEAHPAWVAAFLLGGALLWVTRQWLKSLADVLQIAKQFAAVLEVQNNTNKELLDRIDRIERRFDRA